MIVRKVILAAIFSLPLLRGVFLDEQQPPTDPTASQAAPADAGSDALETWISYGLDGGPLAVFLFLLVTDRLTTTSERDRLRTELTAAHEREETLNNNIRADVAPLLAKNTEVLGRVADLLTKLLARTERE